MAQDLNNDAPSLSLVIPIYQEKDNIKPLFAQVHKGLKDYNGSWELICVDDGSRDGSGKRLREEAKLYGSHVRIIELRRNFGQTAAMQTGIEAARGELVATMDGDLQNDPADIPRMVQELQDRDLDLLAGWRKKRQDGLFLRKVPSKIANRIIAKSTGVRIHDYGCSLKVYRNEVLKEIRLFGEMHRFIPVWIANVTSPDRIGETVVNHSARIHGESKYGLSRTFRVILDLLFVFFFLKYRHKPGHFFGSIGLGFGMVGGLIMTYLATVKFILGEDIGSRPLLFIGVLLVIASIQFLTTGLVAEMLSRIFFDSDTVNAHHIARQDPPGQAGWSNDEEKTDATV